MSISQQIQLEPNRYVGREEDLIALARCYERLDRLVTIVGPPGTGKSRLARHYAHARAKRTGAQTYFFDLTDAASADDVSNVVARVLGLSAHGATTELNVGQLGHALHARGPALFVFDNFEHIVSSAAVILVRWLETAAQGHFLVTSRELLRVSGETAYELLPLSDDHAIDLFLDRVRTVRSDYVPTDEEQSDLLAIVRALDCIPLALELAATRMSILSPAQLRSRLHERFKILSKGPRNAGKRQSTLRGTIDLSWTLLSSVEQSALAQCSVFRGGFALEAAESIIDLSSYGESLVLDTIQELCGKSLVRSYTLEQVPGERRFGLYQSIRDYAWEKLAESTESDTAIQRHLEYFARLGTPERASSGLTSVAEYDNLVAAFHRASEDYSDPKIARAMTQCVLALDRVVSSRGCFATQLHMLNCCLETTELDSALAARTLLARGNAHKNLGHMDQAMTDLTQALDKSAGEESQLQASILCAMGEVSQAGGKLKEAEGHLQSAVSIAEETAKGSILGRIYARLGNLQHSRGELEEAWTSYEQAVQCFRAAGDLPGAASVLKDFGTLRLQQGRLEEARQYYSQALVSYEEHADRRSAGLIFGNLGILEQELGNLDEAARCYEQALQNLRTIGDRMLEGHLLGYLGGLLREKGELSNAHQRYRDAIEILETVGDRRQQGLFLSCSASINATIGHAPAAERELAAAKAMLSDLGDPALLRTLELNHAHLELLYSRNQMAAGNARSSDTHVLAAVSILNAEGAGSDDTRSAHRILRRAIHAQTWIIAQDGTWFQAPNQPLVGIEKRPALFPLLAALAEYRQSTPDKPLLMEELLEIGWPGESVVHEAGISRVKVALATLRKLGLRDLLLRSKGGYMLDPSLPVVMQ